MTLIKLFRLRRSQLQGRPDASFTRLVPTLLLVGLVVAGMETVQGQVATGTQAKPAKSQSSSASLSGPLKIVKLLWTSNAENAAKTLTRSITVAVARRELEPLRVALQELQPQTRAVLATGNLNDPRYAPSLAAAMLDGSLANSTVTIEQALLDIASLDQRQMLWQVWLLTNARATEDFFVSQLTDSQADHPSPIEAQSARARQSSATGESQADEWTSRLISDALAIHREWASPTLLEHWAQLRPSAALAAIEPLTSNAQSMELLLDAVEQANVPKDLINTNQLRKWLSSNNTQLISRIESIWGTVRAEDDVARQGLVAQTLDELKLGARGSASRGALVFDRVCSQCHALHGRGFEVGPNIAGNGRGNLQQLVSNILDPSLVIGEAFQAKTVLTVDGEVVAGLVVAENDRYLKLKVQGGKIVEFDFADIEQVKTSSKSLMPEGVETQMQPQELFDLLAYLCLLNPPNSPENEFIPGTPAGFVER